MLDVTIKDKDFSFIEVHGPRELSDIWGCIEPFATSSRQVVLALDSNAVLDPNIDRWRASQVTNNFDAKYFLEFVVSLTGFGKSIFLRWSGLKPIGTLRVGSLALSTE